MDFDLLDSMCLTLVTLVVVYPIWLSAQEITDALRSLKSRTQESRRLRENLLQRSKPGANTAVGSRTP